MTSDRELLGQAFDVLDNIRAIDLYHADGEEVLETIRLRLAEPEEADADQLARIAKLVDEVDPYPEAKPAAWCYPPDMEWLNGAQSTSRSVPVWSKPIDHYKTPLYLHPLHPAETEEAEPVAYVTYIPDAGLLYTTEKPEESHYPVDPLFLHPPRPAVRLSDDEVTDLQHYDATDWDDLCRAIETAVLKKNGIEVKDE